MVDRFVDQQKVTLSVVGQSADVVLRQLCIDHGVSYVIESDTAKRTVSIDLDEVGVYQAVRLVARAAGVESVVHEGVVYIGQLAPEDDAAFVTRAGALKQEEALQVCQLVVTGDRVRVTGSGLIVAAGPARVMQRLAQMLQDVRAYDREQWIVQVHLLEVHERDIDNLGVDADLSAALDVVAGTVASNASASAELDMVLNAVRRVDRTKVHAEPVFLLNESEPFRFRRGERVPVVTSIANQQTVSTTVQFEEVGFGIEFSLRRTQAGAILAYSITDDRVARFQDGYPIVSGYELSGELEAVSGQTYLLSSLDTATNTESWWRRAGVGEGTTKDGSVSQVWLRAYRVGSLDAGPTFRSEVVSGRMLE